MNCAHCGKNLSTDELRGDNCRYCGTALPHRAQAAKHAAVVQEMFADRNGNGIPDAFEGVIANAQRGAHVYAASHVSGPGVAHVHVVSSSHAVPHAFPPHAFPPNHHLPAAHATAAAASAISAVVVVAVVGALVVLTAAGGIAFFLLGRG